MVRNSTPKKNLVIENTDTSEDIITARPSGSVLVFNSSQMVSFADLAKGVNTKSPKSIEHSKQYRSALNIPDEDDEFYVQSRANSSVITNTVDMYVKPLEMNVSKYRNILSLIQIITMKCF